MQKRLLLIAYYFPPLGMSGVQRVLKWAKYLPDNGWKVTVLTAHPAAYFARDNTLLSDLAGKDVEIVRTRSLDPTRWTRSSNAGLPAENKRRFFARISQAVFQPDNKIGWYPFAMTAGQTILEKESFDAILSSAPPYTSHLIGAALSRKYHVPLYVEYRDDWIQNPRHQYPSQWHRQLSVDMERRVFEQATGAIAINDVIADNLRQRAGQTACASNICVIPHGFDPEDLRPTITRQEGGVNPNQEPRPIEFLYSGVFYDVQIPDTFLRGMALFLKNRPEERSNIRARFCGLTPHYMSDLVDKLGLTDCVIIDGYLNHEVATDKLLVADVLWMTVGHADGANMISTGKLFEYFGSKKPILGLVPDGVARVALQKYGASVIVDPDDIDGTAAGIQTMFEAAKMGITAEPDQSFIDNHNREYLARQLSEFLSE